MEDLKKWKNSASRKPLLIFGARQVGKTWLMQEFGKSEYKNVVYINFDSAKAERLKNIFAADLYIKRIISDLEVELQQKIIPADTLIIFDEIQECNRALVSLKYFNETANDYNIIAAGSLLGVAMHDGNSFPVGKTDMMTLYPLTFIEFLYALGEERFVKIINELDWHKIKIFKEDIIKYLKYYFFIGGMPEAVFDFANNKDFDKIQTIQRNILRSYSMDFSKHIAATDIPKVGLIWDCIHNQLAKDNNKFVYRDIKQSARARDYENAILWLINSGLAYQITRIKLPNLPLSAYQEREHFKLYMIDIGLLSCQSGLEIKTILDANNNLFSHFKGALAEQFALQELRSADTYLPIFYWGTNNEAEIDFLIQYDNKVIPIEVKSSTNRKAKSLMVYMKSHNPSFAIRASLGDYSRNESLYDMPIFMLSQYKKVCGQ
jgi:predicted AAA+ superfamily ATPase